jgi:hypothetical protein
MQFGFAPLAWGFLLVLLPLLIHLINLVRHRRTPWAAMEFLLESYRKNRRWIWLKQALLIASRMLAMALLVAMLAQWVTDSKLFSWLGRSTVHHYVILDDSASMADTANGKSAYQSALTAIASIASAAKLDSQNHLISVFRASRVSLASSRAKEPSEVESKTDGESKPVTESVRADSVADLLAQTIPSDPSSLLSKLNSTFPTQIECELAPPLDAIAPLLKTGEDERAIIYLMSDFRTKDWANPVALRQRLASLKNDRIDVQLIDCVEARHENLTIAAIEPRQEVLAAGVPTMINVTVRNNGAAPVRNVAARITAVDYSQRSGEPKAMERFSGLVTELPPLVFERIEAGEAATRNVQVVFPKSGSHVVQAELPPDSLGNDNIASCVLDIADGVRVLLVDGDAGGKHSFFFESALNPGGNAKTGLLISREGVEFLRDTEAESLDNYACIILQSIPSLDPRALANLHQYVSRGGGLSIWFGDNVTAADYMRSYAVWNKPIPGTDPPSPLLPFTLRGVAELTKAAGDMTPDIIADNHPIFAPLLGMSNSPFQFVRIQRYVEIDGSNQVAASRGADGASTTGTAGTESNEIKLWKPVATLRNGQPLLIDYPIGQGRVLIALTSLDRRWSNWPQDPTFVVAALKMVGYLSSFKGSATSKPTGASLRWDFSSQEMLPETQLLFPPPSVRAVRPTLQINAAAVGENTLQATLDARNAIGSNEVTRGLTTSGLFEWWGTSIQGEPVNKNLARNTPASEGELDRVAPADLNRNLGGLKFTYRSAFSVGSNLANAGLSNRNMLLMALLVLLLLAEQWLAWSTSYHLPKRG